MTFPIVKGVTVLKKFNASKRKQLLENFLKTHSISTLNDYNMMYVLQSMNDFNNNIYKIGVSAGPWRLREYDRFFGPSKNSEGQCGGAYLIFLAGQKSPYRKARTKKQKDEADIKFTYQTKKHWSKRKEKQIFEILQEKGFIKMRGNEWWQIPDERLDEFKEVVNGMTPQITKEDLVKVRRSQRVKKKTMMPS